MYMLGCGFFCSTFAVEILDDPCDSVSALVALFFTGVSNCSTVFAGFELTSFFTDFTAGFSALWVAGFAFFSAVFAMVLDAGLVALVVALVVVFAAFTFGAVAVFTGSFSVFLTALFFTADLVAVAFIVSSR